MQTNVQELWRFFNGHRFAIPSYQREYAWRAGVEAQKLWDDVDEFVTRADSEKLFLGLLSTFQSDNDKDLLQVVDGQQRLVTILLLLCAIRDHGQSVKAGIAFDDYDRLCIYKNQGTKAESEDGAPFRRISVFYKDGQAAIDAIVHGEGGFAAFQKGRSGRESSVTLKNITEVYKLFQRHLKAKFPKARREERDARANEIAAFMSHITKGIQFCVLITQDEQEALSMFEAMNNRGRALTGADLLKHQLLSEGPRESADGIARLWDSVFDGVGKDSNKTLKFVRTFALAHLPLPEIAEKRLFATLGKQELVAKLGGPIAALTLMTDDLARIGRMQAGNLPSGHHSDAFKHFLSMNPPAAHVPLLLAVDRAAPQASNRLVEGMIDIHLCGRIAGLKPHLIGNMLAELRVAFLSGGLDELMRATDDTIAELAAKAIPRFETLRLDGSQPSENLIRSLLSRLYWFVENSIERHAGRPTGFHQFYQIEHIFPQRAEADYRDEFMNGVDESLAPAIIGNIGNLLLLDGSANAAGGNERFHVKRDLYRASSAYLNRALVDPLHDGRGTHAARTLAGFTAHKFWNRDSIATHAADKRRIFERYLQRQR